MHMMVARRVCVCFLFSSNSQLDLLLARTINPTGFQPPLHVASTIQRHQPTLSTPMSNTNHRYQGVCVCVCAFDDRLIARFIL